jgi:hypothetical protein
MGRLWSPRHDSLNDETTGKRGPNTVLFVDLAVGSAGKVAAMPRGAGVALRLKAAEGEERGHSTFPGIS